VKPLKAENAISSSLHDKEISSNKITEPVRFFFITDSYSSIQSPV